MKSTTTSDFREELMSERDLAQIRKKVVEEGVSEIRGRRGCFSRRLTRRDRRFLVSAPGDERREAPENDVHSDHRGFAAINVEGNGEHVDV